MAQSRKSKQKGNKRGIRVSEKFGKLYDSIENVVMEFLKFESRYNWKHTGYIHVSVKLDSGEVSFPFNEAWFMRSVEYYGMTDAVKTCSMLLQYWNK